MRSRLSRLSELLFPSGKLVSHIPWNAREASARYLRSLIHFAVGSFAIPLLFIGAVMAVVYYQDIVARFGDTLSTAPVLAAVFAIAALPTYLLVDKRQKSKGRIDRAKSFAYATVAGMAAVLAMTYGLVLIGAYHFEILHYLVGILDDGSGNANMTFVMVLSTIGFVMGFGMQMRYIDKSLKEAGSSLTRFMALSLETRRGSTAWMTALNVLWPAALAYLLWLPVQSTVIHILGPLHQPTAEMARNATGGNFVLFALMAVVGAPIFEEIVFRGFLFQIMRGILRKEHEPAPLTEQPQSGSYLWLRSKWTSLDNLVRRASNSLYGKAHKLLSPRADLLAIIGSSLMFAVLHMQFQPTALVLLFLLGCIHAEVYRRTGSLYCSIALHAINNGISVLMLALSMY